MSNNQNTEHHFTLKSSPLPSLDRVHLMTWLSGFCSLVYQMFQISGHVRGLGHCVCPPRRNLHFNFLISADTGQRQGSPCPQWVVHNPGSVMLTALTQTRNNRGRDKKEADSPNSVVQPLMLFTTCCGFFTEVVFSDPRLLLAIPSKCRTSHLCVFDLFFSFFQLPGYFCHLPLTCVNSTYPSILRLKFLPFANISAHTHLFLLKKQRHLYSVKFSVRLLPHVLC